MTALELFLLYTDKYGLILNIRLLNSTVSTLNQREA